MAQSAKTRDTTDFLHM